MRAAIVSLLVAIAPAGAAAQGLVLRGGGSLPGPELDPDQAVYFVKREDVTAGDTITMAVQPRFTTSSPGTSFAVLLATPAPPLYATETSYLFESLAAATATRIEERLVEVEDPSLGSRCEIYGCGGQPADGCGGGSQWITPGVPDATFGDGAVDVIPIGPYEILRLTAADTTELAAWLDQFGYVYTQADLDAVAPYLARGDTITAIRVIVEDPSTTALEVLTLTWSGSELRVPFALGRPPAGQTSRLAVYISAPGRHDLPGRTPVFAARGALRTDFLTRTDVVVPADATIDGDPLAVANLTEAEIIPYEIVEVVVLVPVTECEQDRDDGSGGCCASANRRVRWDAIFVAAAMLLSLRRRRQPRQARPSSESTPR